MDSYLYQRALEGTPVPVVVFTHDQRPVFVNQSMRDLLSRLRTVGPPIRALTRGTGFKVAGTDFQYPSERWPVPRALLGEEALVDDVAWSAAGKERTLEVHAGPLLDDSGVPTHAVALYRDVSWRRSPSVPTPEGDPITRLPTRDAAESTFTAARDRMRRRPGKGVACVLLRVLHFDDVVIRHGIDVGDQVLQGIGDGLRESVRRVDHPHRVGPSTFLIVCESVRNHMQAVRLARRLATDIQGDYPTTEGSVQIEVAAGASFSQDPQEQLGRLARSAGRLALEEWRYDL